jgi:hypothetical protein
VLHEKLVEQSRREVAATHAVHAHATHAAHAHQHL